MVLERLRTRRGLGSARPFREMVEMENLFESPLAGWPVRMALRRAIGEHMALVPSVDVYEKEDCFMICAELPGVNMEECDISVTGETLTIKGERQQPESAKGAEYLCSEIAYGNFSRSIDLPAGCDSSKIDATCHNGMLDIKLEKVKEAKPARIQVHAK